MSGSKNYSQEDLLQLLEDLQQENEDLRQANTEKEQTLQYLTERIETLSESDKQLQSARQHLKKSEENLQEARAEAEAMTARAYKAEQSEARAKQLLAEAREKDAKAESHISSRVSSARAQIERENAQKLQEATVKARVLNSSLAPALALYSVILTLIWAIGKKEVIETLPQWFVNRWENIKTIAAAIKTAFLAVHDWTPETWAAFPRYIPSILICTGIVIGLFFLVRAAVRRFTAWNKDIWDNYRDKTEKRLKWAYTVAICLISFLLSVILAQHTPLLWFSWYLIISIPLNLIYHATGKNHSYW